MSLGPTFLLRGPVKALRVARRSIPHTTQIWLDLAQKAMSASSSSSDLSTSDIDSLILNAQFSCGSGCLAAGINAPIIDAGKWTLWATAKGCI